MRFAKSAAILGGLVLAGQSQAAQFFLTTTPTLDAAGAAAASLVNPTITIPAVGQTVPAYIWVKLLPLTPNTVAGKTPTERLNSMGLDLTESTDRAHAQTYFLDNTDGVDAGTTDGRWDVPSSLTGGPATASGESAGHPTLTSMRRGAVTSIGATNANPNRGGDHDPNNVTGTDGNFYERIATVSITGDSLGTTPLFFKTNSFSIAYSTGQTTVNFGAGDAAVQTTQDTGGRVSNTADATLIVGGVVPEPASLSLLGLGGLGWLRRRRKA